MSKRKSKPELIKVLAIYNIETDKWFNHGDNCWSLNTISGLTVKGVLKLCGEFWEHPEKYSVIEITSRKPLKRGRLSIDKRVTPDFLHGMSLDYFHLLHTEENIDSHYGVIRPMLPTGSFTFTNGPLALYSAGKTFLQGNTKTSVGRIYPKEG